MAVGTSMEKGITGVQLAWRVRLTLARITRQRLLLAGLIIVGVFVVATLFAPWLAPYNPTESTADWLVGPSLEHPMGTDQLRRDVWSRVLHGGWIPLGPQRRHAGADDRDRNDGSDYEPLDREFV